MPKLEAADHSKESPDKRADASEDNEKRSIGSKVGPITQADSDSLVKKSKIETALDPKDGFPNPKFEGDASDASLKKLDKTWAVSLDITVHLGTDTEKAQRERLLSLAESTRGKSVALVVQDVEPGKNGTPAELHRFMIADGAVKELPTEKSKGFAEDAASLIKKTNELVNGTNTAFIEMGHGNGNFGFKGDDGPAEVKQLADALKKANGGPLNDIVLDSCLMAQDGALKALAGAAKDDIVASAELGGNEDDSVRGLNYEKTLSHLIADPSMTGKTFAKQFIEDGREGANIYTNRDGKPDAGIQTLTAFDPKKIDEFEDKLGKFGEALKQAEGDPENRAALQKIIAGTFKYNMAAVEDQKRDVGAFATAVKDAVAKGDLKDPEHLLERTAQHVLDAQKGLTDDTYGQGRFAGLGGLSVFLPSSDHTHQLDNRDPGLLDMIESTVGRAVTKELTDERTEGFLHRQIELLTNAVSGHPELADEIRQLAKIDRSLADSSTSDARKQSNKDFQTLIASLHSDDAFIKALTQVISYKDNWDLQQSENPGWSNFIKSLYGNDMFETRA